MSYKVPRSFIDTLLSKVDIVRLIGGTLSLKKAGKEFTACCPFHSEKTPSFTVSPVKQFYHCFGCGAHGNAISFVMAYDKMSFMEALEKLASEQGLSLPKGQNIREDKEDYAPLFEILEKAIHYYHQQLLQSEQAQFARHYLQKDRGLTLKTIKAFEIGFAPNAWNNLSLQFGFDRKQTKNWVQAGLLIERDSNQFYDRFRNRIMFPIRNRRGQPIGFGGRVLSQDEKPKYLNSPETPIFHKGYELYGLYPLIRENKRPPYILVVEGYMDAIALVQHGITFSVATLGTALTVQHLEMLFRYSPEVVFCFDGDLAGRKAAERALDVALPFLGSQNTIRFISLPNAEDPDTWIRKVGKDSFEQQIKAAAPLASFLVESLKSSCDLTRVDGHIQLIQQVKAKLAKTSDPMIRYPILRELSQKTHIELSVLSNALEQTTEPSSFFSHTLSSQNKLLSPTPLVKKTLQLLLQYPALGEQIEDTEALKGIQLPGMGLLLHVLERLKKEDTSKLVMILEDLRGTEWEEQISEFRPNQLTLSEREAALELKGAILKLLALKKQHEVDELLQKSRTTALSSEEKTRLQSLLESVQT